MANIFERELGIPLPKCCSLGSCCKGASPSTPYHQLMQRAADGDEFARGFFSIMVPYASHADAEAVVPGVVERTLKAAEKLSDFAGPEDIVFYRCQYQTADNKCGVWEDRPQFCRDYPDTPFVVMAPGCAFEPWAAACKEKYHAMKGEVARLKELKEELARLREAQNPEPNAPVPADVPAPQASPPPAEAAGAAEGDPYTKIDAPFSAGHNQNMENLSLVLSLTRLYVASPLHSVYLV